MDPDPVDAIRADWRRERPDLDTTPMDIFGRLIRVRTLAEAQIAAALGEHGLSIPAFDVLASLRRAGPPYRKTPTELAATSMLTTGGVTFRLDRLEEAGLIQRVRSAEDRRVVYAELTEEGLARINQALDHHLENEHALLAGMEPEDIAALGPLLRRLEQSVRQAEWAATGSVASPAS